ncbi:MAG: flavodoxin family protein [Acetobacter sp.]|nr:flavodoxin family protein [Bacteroides sp.]MCM1340787.1 flavodoxin family protein [Acetobacter sp.]MCM1432656.1 flavodoxin family protein [Clostridiales bacterium]
MKITCLVGSARINGSTNFIVDSFIKGVHENHDIEVKKYHISKLNINYCLGCKKCYENGICIQNDDVKNIVEDILTSDFVVIASPSYWGDVPGQLKTFFDRNTPYGNTNEKRILFSKTGAKGIAIAIRAGKTEKENSLILDYIEHYLGHLDIEPIIRISLCETDSLDDLMSKHKSELNYIYNIGKNIMMYV